MVRGIAVDPPEPKEADMPSSDHPSNLDRHDPAHHHKPIVEEELELERRTRARLRAAEQGGLQWRRGSPNQRYVAHRRGNR